MTRSDHRLKRRFCPSLRNWQKVKAPGIEKMKHNVSVEMGWGRLVFGQTFDSTTEIVHALTTEGYDRRDIAMYIKDPHVVLAQAPDKLFLDPSHTYRLWSHDYFPEHQERPPFQIQRLSSLEEAEELNRIYARCNLKGADPEFILGRHAARLRTYLVARSASSGRIIGTVSGVDHVEAFQDPENGASLWSLAVDPQTREPGVGIGLVRHLMEHYFTRGRSYVDISVIHDNHQAINLYEKLGCKRIPVFCIKRKNTINEHLFVPDPPGEQLNPYARIIVDEARRRGIEVRVVNETFGIFQLMLGGKAVTCRESLSERTSAVAMTLCDDKRLTHQTLAGHGIRVPRQQTARTDEQNIAFMEQVKRVVVKPARGEQGEGVSVDLSDPEALTLAVEKARRTCNDVILEEFVQGEDLRIIVINAEVVAAAVRRPPTLVGTGKHTVKQLVGIYNRRRMAATGGESQIPLDRETDRCLANAGFGWQDILPKERKIVVRKTANLHTGGTIHDVTDRLSETLKTVAVRAAQALSIPVTGLDFMIPDVTGDEYVIIEANERPGLANHEPRPTAEKFIDFLFPETVQPQEMPSHGSDQPADI